MFFAYVYPAHLNLVPAPLWKDLLDRFGKLVEYPDPGAPFRGSLIDPHLFAIDVNEWGFADQLSTYRIGRGTQNSGQE